MNASAQTVRIYTQKSVLSENTLKQIIKRISDSKTEPEIKIILANSSKRIKVSFPMKEKEFSGDMFRGCLVIHNELNDLSIGEIMFNDEIEVESAEAHSILNSMKYSLLGIPAGGAELIFAFEQGRYSKQNRVKIFKEFFLMLSDDVLTSEMNLSIIKLKNDENYPLIIKALNEIENPKKAHRLAFLIGAPNEIGGLSAGENLEEVWINNFLTKIMSREEGKKIKVLIHGINSRSISAAKHFETNGLSVIGIGEKGYALYSQKGLSCEDLELAGMRVCNEKFEADYYDFLKKSADIFVEMSCEGAIDSVIAEMLNVKAVAETVDFSIQEYAFNILEKRGITVIPSILLAVSGNILNYLEFLQKKRGEEMTKSEVEMRFESFQMQMESLLAPDISGNSLTQSLYSKAVGDYEKKYRILYGEKTKE
ncbi:TPA: hypothetical protein DCW38_03465 [candidate division WOR-3 bacterium]|uniref:Uncharacterized protein n=1 Tax=candidate division WOR-3 bacterium TaxID=2052148 RepID=A0A350H9K5_UNCW3|nr:hypothetical protein [candidate division WOR-3 bacterium]